MEYTLDSVITELNIQITANLERQVLDFQSARCRILLIEDWCEGLELWYSDYLAVMPEQFRTECATLVSQISQLRVKVDYFAPYLLTQHVDPLLKAEAQLLYI